MRPSRAKGVQAWLLEDERSGIFALSAVAGPAAHVAIAVPARRQIHSELRLSVVLRVSGRPADLFAKSDVIRSSLRPRVRHLLAIKRHGTDACFRRYPGMFHP